MADMLKTVVTEVPGKINLSLDITGTRPDGFHTLNTIMQAIDLCETVTVSRMSGTGVFISCDHPRIPCDETNLAYIAAKRFFESFSIPQTAISIDIQKRIPMQAGLAGGSADAAGVLAAMNVLFDVNANTADLCALAAKIGADVPFCLRGGTVQAQGIGAEFTSLPGLPKCHIVIAKPIAGISTPESYKRYDQYGVKNRPNIDYLIHQLRMGNLKELASSMYNVLEEVAEPEDIPYIEGKMISAGALGALMSGSGSAVFGIFDSRSLAKHCTRKLYGAAQSVFLVRPVSHGAVVLDVRE